MELWVCTDDGGGILTPFVLSRPGVYTVSFNLRGTTFPHTNQTKGEREQDREREREREVSGYVHRHTQVEYTYSQ